MLLVIDFQPGGLSRDGQRCVGEIDQDELGGEKPVAGGAVIRGTQEHGFHHRHDPLLGRVGWDHGLARLAKLLQFDLECFDALDQFLDECPVANRWLGLGCRCRLVLAQCRSGQGGQRNKAGQAVPD